MKLLKIFINNYLSVFVVISLLVIFGWKSYQSLPRETFPEIKVPYIFVNTLYLGVSPKDIEILVTNPLEKNFKNLKGLKTVQSYSKESYSSIFLEFEPEVDVDTALQRVKDKVDLSKKDLPEDAEDTIVKEFNLDDFPFININLFGKYDLNRLTKIAEDLKEGIEQVDGILEVNMIGGQEREIQIIISPQKLQEKNLSFSDIKEAVQVENINIPGGNIDIGKIKYSIRIPGEFKKIHSIQNLIVEYQKGNPIYLKDVAEVKDSFKDQESYSRFNGKSSITLAVKKRTGYNILKASETVKKETNKFLSHHKLQNLEVYFLGDMSKYVRNMIKDLENNILTGFFLVFFVLLIFLGVKNATLAGLSIPFSMLTSFMVLHLLGFTANFIVLFSLVLALGMLVDNAIVIIENIHRYFQSGMSIKKAAFKGATQVSMPVITSTLTTLVAFLALIFWPGIMGKFMGYLPKTLIITLSSSLLIALFITPVIIANFHRFYIFALTLILLLLTPLCLFVTGKASFMPVFKVTLLIATIIGFFSLVFFVMKSSIYIKSKTIKKMNIKNNQNKKESFIIKLYEQILTFSLKHCIVILISIIFLFIFTLFAYGKWGQKPIFFPELTPTEGYVNLELPPGSIISETDKIANEIDGKLKNYTDIKNFNTNIALQSNNGMHGSSGKTASNKAQFTLEFYDRNLDNVPKEFNPMQTLSDLRNDLKYIPGAKIEVKRDENGPPRGAPVSIKIAGDNFEKLKLLSSEVKNYIQNIPGLINLKDDYEEGLPEIVIRLDRQKMAVLGVNTSKVASAIRTAIYGEKVSVFRDVNTEEEYDMTIRYPRQNRQNIENLESIFIKNFQGNNIPLKIFSDIYFSKGVGYVIHKDFERVIEVTAELTKNANAQEIRNKVKTILKKKLNLPQGYKISFTGEAESQEESSSFLKNAFILAIFLIFLVLITQFHSFLMPFIVLATILLSMIGFLWGLIITKTAFTIVMSGIGIISLAGIVVNNGIVLLEYIIELRNEGKPKLEAIITAGKIRFRPVMLTAITTILGLLPMSTGYSFDFYNLRFAYSPEATEWWSSMSNGLIFGLLVATLLTLVVVPTMYYLSDNIKEWTIKKLFN